MASVKKKSPAKTAAKRAPSKKAPAKKPAAKKAAAKKAAPAKRPAAKKMAAPAKKVAAAKKPTAKAVQAAKKKLALAKLAAAGQAARLAKAGRAKSSPTPLYTDGVLVASNSPSGVAFQFADQTVTLEEVALAGEFVGLLVPLKAAATASPDGGPSLLQRLGEFLSAHADGQVEGGVTTCRNNV